MSGSKPSRPQPQYMSGPANSAFTPLGFQGVHSGGISGAQNAAYPDMALANLGFFLPQQGLGGQVTAVPLTCISPVARAGKCSDEPWLVP